MTTLKNQCKKKNNFSPKNFIKSLFGNFKKTNDSRIIVKKLSPKISQEDFLILEFYEFENLRSTNYNVSQLKKMCRFYKQLLSGNKPTILNRLYYFLKLSNDIVKIQKYYRGWQRRHYFKLNNFKNIGKCVNDTDFLTLQGIKKIPYYQFYSYKDVDGFIYGFNIKSLYNLMMQNKGDLKNPYNRKELPKNIVKNMRKFILLSNIYKEPIEINLKKDNEVISLKKKISLKTLSIFHRIDTFGHITNTSWFLTLNRESLIRFLRELIDIWEYRANLSNENKRKICPPHGTPFRGININSLAQKNTETLQKNILYIMENLISKGIDKDSRSLGAFYILAALTLVSSNAAAALPWLYQSVAQM